jgi:hypothetical protein
LHENLKIFRKPGNHMMECRITKGSKYNNQVKCLPSKHEVSLLPFLLREMVNSRAETEIQDELGVSFSPKMRENALKNETM